MTARLCEIEFAVKPRRAILPGFFSQPQQEAGIFVLAALIPQALIGRDRMNRAFERILHLPCRIVREFLGYVQLIPLPLINRYSRFPVTAEDGPVVSLTTYGQRARTVYLAIESIARGEVLPSRLILWIDEIDLFNNLPKTLRRLQNRGLEVRLCENYGPHKKYYPYVESQKVFDDPLVTADDDILYPRYWLRKLVDAYREFPGTVNCYFAGSVEFDKTMVTMCLKWSSCHSTGSSFLYHPLGGAGVIYPPLYLIALKDAGTAFRNCCPTQDDLWHHVMALRTGYRVRQILPLPPYFSFQSIPGTYRSALKGSGEDWQVAATYTESDIQMLRAEFGAAAH
jgi:hypothetical protein